MRFEPTRLAGAFLLEIDRLEDERGFFARTFCQREFEEHGVNARIAQCSVSFNPKRGTLRGMHYQVAPAKEVKLVRCTRGAIYDVIVDLRLGSPTRWCWIAARLSAENRRMLLVPEDFAHGYQTLTDHAEVFYQTSEFHADEYSRGIRWNDPRLDIVWPIPSPFMSERDRTYPLLAP